MLGRVLLIIVLCVVCVPSRAESKGAEKVPVVVLGVDVARRADGYVVERVWFGDAAPGDLLQFEPGECWLRVRSVVALVRGKEGLRCVSASDGRGPRYWFDALTLDALLARQAEKGVYGAALAQAKREASAQREALGAELDARLAASGCDADALVSVALRPDGRREPFKNKDSRWNHVAPDEALRCATTALEGWRGASFEGETLVWARGGTAAKGWFVEDLGFRWAGLSFGRGGDLGMKISIKDGMWFLNFIYYYNRDIGRDGDSYSLMGWYLESPRRKKIKKKKKQDIQIEVGEFVAPAEEIVEAPVETPQSRLRRRVGIGELPLICLFDGLDLLKKIDSSNADIVMCALRGSPSESLKMLEDYRESARGDVLTFQHLMTRALARWDGVSYDYGSRRS